MSKIIAKDCFKESEMGGYVRYNYKIAWSCLLICLRNGYSLDCWIAPIPVIDKPIMVERAKLFLERENQPTLFGKEC